MVAEGKWLLLFYKELEARNIEKIEMSKTSKLRI